MNITLDKNTEYIISALNNAGFSAYAVGGCVRDMLLGREVDDFDITTSALPEEIKTVFSSFPVIETGIKHGTVTVLIDRKPYEVTTFRTESCYTDSRHPDSVTFVRDLASDLARRDFTVNAIAFSPREGIVDPFGGIEDLKKQILRAVGDPYQRFNEDALRILRALRFSSKLGFSIEKNTSKAIFALSDSILKVSKERVYAELKKLLCGKNAVPVITEYLSVIKKIIPVNGEIPLLEKLPRDYRFRFSALCGGSVADVLSSLRADNETKHICKLLADSVSIPAEKIALKHYISALGRESSLLVASYRRFLYGEDAKHLTESLLTSGEPLFLQDLAVNGSDLISLGIKGENIGKTLKNLLTSVLNGEIENTKQALTHHALSLL